MPHDTSGESGTPETNALIARHRAETQALYMKYPRPGESIPGLREHATRQTTELIEHVEGMELRLTVARAEAADADAAAKRWYAAASPYATPEGLAAALAEAEALRSLLREWVKKADKFPELSEFRGGYKPFLLKATRKALSAGEARDG